MTKFRLLVIAPRLLVLSPPPRRVRVDVCSGSTLPVRLRVWRVALVPASLCSLAIPRWLPDFIRQSLILIRQEVCKQRTLDEEGTMGLGSRVRLGVAFLGINHHVIRARSLAVAWRPNLASRRVGTRDNRPQ